MDGAGAYEGMDADAEAWFNDWKDANSKDDKSINCIFEAISKKNIAAVYRESIEGEHHFPCLGDKLYFEEESPLSCAVRSYAGLRSDDEKSKAYKIVRCLLDQGAPLAIMFCGPCSVEKMMGDYCYLFPLASKEERRDRAAGKIVEGSFCRIEDTSRVIKESNTHHLEKFFMHNNPLKTAVAFSSKPMVQLLCKHGPNALVKYPYAQTSAQDEHSAVSILYTAIEYYDEEIIDYLLAAGALIDLACIRFALHEKHTDLLKKLLNHIDVSLTCNLPTDCAKLPYYYDSVEYFLSDELKEFKYKTKDILNCAKERAKKRFLQPTLKDAIAPNNGENVRLLFKAGVTVTLDALKLAVREERLEVLAACLDQLKKVKTIKVDRYKSEEISCDEALSQALSEARLENKLTVAQFLLDSGVKEPVLKKRHSCKQPKKLPPWRY